MMSKTSRRRFLQGAAAAAALATTAACDPGRSGGNGSGGGSASGGNAGGGGTQPAPAPAPAAAAIAAKPDEVVASTYLKNPMFLDPTLAGKPTATCLLYGLLCVDFGHGLVLVPNSDSLSGIGVHKHTPKLFVRKDKVDAGSAAEDGFVPGGIQFSFWDLTGQLVTIEALDGAGAVLPPVTNALAWRNNPNHPWTDQKWVRCLKELTNKDITSDLANPTLITTRVEMPNGRVTALPPTTDHGRYKQWKVTKFNGDEMLKATTDSMVWQGEFTGTPAKYRIRLTSSAGTKEIKVTATNKSMMAAITSSMNMPPGDVNRLTDTKAYARLLVGGNPNTHPEPSANPAISVMSSGSDGHCECACN
jgi:hypothetical protein